MTATTSIRVEHKDGLAIVTLAEAARGNPFDDTFTRDFKQVFSRAVGRQGSARGAAAGRWRQFQLRRRFEGVRTGARQSRSARAPLDRRPAHGAATRLEIAGAGRSPPCKATPWAAVRRWRQAATSSWRAQSARIGSAFTKIGFSCDSGSTVAFRLAWAPRAPAGSCCWRKSWRPRMRCRPVCSIASCPTTQLQDEALTLARGTGARPDGRLRRGQATVLADWRGAARGPARGRGADLGPRVGYGRRAGGGGRPDRAPQTRLPGPLMAMRAEDRDHRALGGGLRRGDAKPAR